MSDDTIEFEEGLSMSEIAISFSAAHDELIPDNSTPPMGNYGSADLYTEFFESEKTFVKLVKLIVQYCRKSPEYRRYTKYLIDNMDMGTCFLASGLNPEEAKRGGLEIHHYPLTIFDLCEIVAIKTKVKRERFTLFSVANEVMKLHYQNRVGLVPLLETYHQAAHAGSLYIPPAVIFGNWISLLEDYKDYLQEKHIDKLAALKSTFENEESMLRRLEVMLKVKPLQWIDRGDDLAKLNQSYSETRNSEATETVNDINSEELSMFIDE